MSKETFRILVICTGNICRSPIAERLLTAGLEQRIGDNADRISVRSAGTWGHEGSPMEAYAERVLADFGVPADGFVARELTTDMVAEADLVLGVTREHRAVAATMVPKNSARMFTVREFDRLAGAVSAADLPSGDVVARARALVREAAAKRGHVPPLSPAADDLADPYGGPLRTFRHIATQISQAIQGPLDLLAAKPPRRHRDLSD